MKSCNQQIIHITHNLNTENNKTRWRKRIIIIILTTIQRQNLATVNWKLHLHPLTKIIDRIEITLNWTEFSILFGQTSKCLTINSKQESNDDYEQNEDDRQWADQTTIPKHSQELNLALHHISKSLYTEPHLLKKSLTEKIK